MTVGAELVDRGVDVDRVPEHDQIDDEPKRAELIFLPFAVTLTKLTALAVEYGAGELVTALAPVELDQDASPVGFVIDEPQHRSEEHTSELQSLMRISYAVFCLKKKKQPHKQ